MLREFLLMQGAEGCRKELWNLRFHCSAQKYLPLLLGFANCKIPAPCAGALEGCVIATQASCCVWDGFTAALSRGALLRGVSLGTHAQRQTGARCQPKVKRQERTVVSWAQGLFWCLLPSTCAHLILLQKSEPLGTRKNEITVVPSHICKFHMLKKTFDIPPANQTKKNKTPTP